MDIYTVKAIRTICRRGMESHYNTDVLLTCVQDVEEIADQYIKEYEKEEPKDDL